jgi:hypothetical protein
MSSGYDRHSPEHDALPWVLIALALIVAGVSLLQSL